MTTFRSPATCTEKVRRCESCNRGSGEVLTAVKPANVTKSNLSHFMTLGLGYGSTTRLELETNHREV